MLDPPSGINAGFAPSGINAGLAKRDKCWGRAKRDKTWVRVKRDKYGLRRAVRHSLPFIGNAVQRFQYPFIQPLALVQDVCFYHHADVQWLFFTVNVDGGFIRFDAYQIGRLVQQRRINLLPCFGIERVYPAGRCRADGLLAAQAVIQYLLLVAAAARSS